jgi:hypothetical protein
LDRLSRKQRALLQFHDGCQAAIGDALILLSQVEIFPVYILQMAQPERLERVLGCGKACRVDEGKPAAGPLG